MGEEELGSKRRKFEHEFGEVCNVDSDEDFAIIGLQVKSHVFGSRHTHICKYGFVYDLCASTHTNAIYWNPDIIQLIGAVRAI